MSRAIRCFAVAALVAGAGCIAVDPSDGLLACNPNGKACPDNYFCDSATNSCVHDGHPGGGDDLGVADDGGAGDGGDGGGGCTTSTDCPSLQSCVQGACTASGCDATHACNGGCCDGSQCVGATACSAGVACGNDGTCPATCDPANGGNGCVSGCCDTTSGQCADGSADAACGSAGNCIACGTGSMCLSQACVCAVCSGAQVCSGSGCVDCSSNPCSGNTPVCDSTTTHSCQPCTADYSVCTGATPYCDSTGACSAAPDSDLSCAHYNPNLPIYLPPNKCVCSTSVACPNGTLCDASDPQNPTCPIACTPDTSTSCFDQTHTFCNFAGNACVGAEPDGAECGRNSDCQHGNCICTDPSCLTFTCAPASYGPCSTYASSGSGTVGTGAQPPTCNGAKACSSGGTTAAFCLSANGQPCSSLTTCAAGICNNAMTGSAGVCAPTSCPACEYWDGSQCQPVPQNSASHSCPSSGCNGSGACNIAAGSPCFEYNGATPGSLGSCMPGYFCDFNAASITVSGTYYRYCEATYNCAVSSCSYWTSSGCQPLAATSDVPCGTITAKSCCTVAGTFACNPTASCDGSTCTTGCGH